MFSVSFVLDLIKRPKVKVNTVAEWRRAKADDRCVLLAHRPLHVLGVFVFLLELPLNGSSLYLVNRRLPAQRSRGDSTLLLTYKPGQGSHCFYPCKGNGGKLAMPAARSCEFEQFTVCITKREKAESEAQRGKPKGTLESEIRNAIS